jgi:DNA-directed RNA polymerase specialized sigma24 family protein
MDMNSQELMNHLKKGDEKLLARIYIQYRNDFISHAEEKFKVDHEILKKIYQNTLISFYNEIQEGRIIKLSASIKSYLFKIGKDLIFEELKKLDKEYLIQLGLKKKVVRKISKSMEAVEKDHNYHIIKDELEKLDEKDALLLKQYYCNNEKIEDIAGTLNLEEIPVVKEKIFKVFENLKCAVLSNPEFIK